MTDTIELPARQCDGCHRCCEGWLHGNAYGFDFYPNRPCQFLSIGKGCSIYANRPEDPCKAYRCQWLNDHAIPEWLKPDKSNVIITARKVGEFYYWDITETGVKMDSSVLNWLFLHCLNHDMFMVYKIGGGLNYLGTEEFINAYKEEHGI